MDSELFKRDRQMTFLQMMYQLLSTSYQSQDINRLTLAYFVISGLDILKALDRVVDKDAVAKWVLSLQAHPRSKAELNNALGSYTVQEGGEEEEKNGGHLPGFEKKK